MKSLLRFLSRFSVFFLFIGLELICFLMMSNTSRVNGIRIASAGIELMGSMYHTTSNISDYFKLKEINEQLSKENRDLYTALEQSKQALYAEHEESYVPEADTAIAMLSDSLYAQLPDSLANVAQINEPKYVFVTAKVINNSFVRQNNYFTIDKGENDGLETEMGIIGPAGVVGIITSISSNYAIATSLLNTRWSVSSKVDNSQYFGNLSWDGKDALFAKLNGIPYHVKVHKGDEIVTSGYSDVFPEGVPVGEIVDYSHKSGSSFLDIEVKLNTNFQNLNYVVVVKNNHIKELMELAKEGMDE